MNLMRGTALSVLSAAMLAALPSTALAASASPVKTGVYRGAVTPLVRGATSPNAIAFAVAGSRITQFALKYHLACADGVQRTVEVAYNPPVTHTGGKTVPLGAISRTNPGFVFQRLGGETFTGASPSDTVVGGILVNGRFAPAPTSRDRQRTKIAGTVTIWGRTAAGVLCQQVSGPRAGFGNFTVYWSGATPNIT